MLKPAIFLPRKTFCIETRKEARHVYIPNTKVGSLEDVE